LKFEDNIKALLGFFLETFIIPHFINNGTMFNKR